MGDDGVRWQRRGSYYESLAAVELEQRGAVVSWPHSDHEVVRCVVDAGGSLARVQVKGCTSCRYAGHRDRWWFDAVEWSDGSEDEDDEGDDVEPQLRLIP